MTGDQQEQSAFVEETMSTILALQKQEKAYSCLDYCLLHADKTPSRTLQSDRKLMLKWSYNVIDYFNLNRETATIAMNYSDRFLQTDKGPEFLNDTEMYQLLCIVSLYLAIKVHESSSLTPKVFVNIGHGNYTVEQIEKMERLLLSTIDWRVNPPTSLCFVRLFLDLMCHDLDLNTRASAYVLARTQTERAVGDYKMLTVPPSQIAYASVVNALEALGYNECDHLFQLFSEDFLQNGLNPLRIRLCSAISWESSFMTVMPRSASSKNTAAKTKPQVDSEESTTPRSVICHTITSRR
jgi:Cyclin, N-terminal domain/Cyclin, C-terminal domain